MNKRCGYCGELWHSTLTQGEQYKCGTIVCGAEVKRHRYCRKLCGEKAYRTIRQPKMKEDRPPKAKQLPRITFWAYRQQIARMQPGQTAFVGLRPRQINTAMRHATLAGPWKVIVRPSGDGSLVSVVSLLDGMDVGESRPYSDQLRHVMACLYYHNEKAIKGSGSVVLSFYEIEGVFWIRRVR